MSEKPKRQVHRVWDEAERRRHGQQIRERFAREREERIREAKSAIEEMLDQGTTISQNEVARRTGISVGFINKHLRSAIEKAKKQQKEAAQKPCTTRSLSTLEKEVERLTLTNRCLREQLSEQKQMNKALLAQVARVVDLEDEVERLRIQNRELLAYWQTSQEKVVNLSAQKTVNKTINKQPSSVEKKVSDTEPESQNTQPTDQLSFSERVETELAELGIALNSTLKRKIKSKPEQVILNAIEALKQAWGNGTVIQSPGGWLAEAIESEWVKNESLQPTPNCQFEVKSNVPKLELEPGEELASPEDLKALRSMFKNSND
jgi:hypothetical protein